MKRAYRIALGILAFAALLAAASCAGRNAGERPVVRVHSRRSGGVETLSYTMRVNITDQINGVSANALDMRVAFRFKNGTVVSRVDMPGSYFPDGQARILLTDQSRRRTAVLLRHGLRPDPALDSDSLSQVLFGTSFNLGLLDASKPFRRLTTSDFSTRMRSLAFDVTRSGEHRVIASRTIADAQGGARKFTLVFDDSAGAVVEATEEGNLQGINYKSESQVSYTSQTLDDGSELVIPYEVNTTVSGNLQGDEALPTVEMPTADAVLSEDEELQLAEDEYVANEFTAGPGEGSVDPNVQIQSTQVRMEDIQINQESDDYFLPDRW